MLFDLDKSKWVFTYGNVEVYEIAAAFYNPFGQPFYFYKLTGTTTFLGPYSTPQAAVDAASPRPPTEEKSNVIHVSFRDKKRL